MAHVAKQKLIEVSLPLEAINRESAREKSIRHGHPSTLHLWWARRPLAAARAVLFAQLVDDPSAHPDRFPTEEAQRAERERLHGIIERLVVWENIRDEKLLAEAHEEILKSTDNHPPPIIDPFCGGGTIPLEAQRLGLEAHASDLNPVAVLITKALIEIPPKFRDQPPVFPGLADSQIRTWKGAEGLAADVRAYGAWMRDEAEKRIGHLYPKADSKTVIAWIWARTVTCPNPACRIEMPLVRSWWLGKKKGKEAYVVPTVEADSTHPSGQRVRFSIGHDPTGPIDGTVGRNGATCIGCGSAVELAYVRGEGRGGRIRAHLMTVVAEGVRQRDYLAPTAAQAGHATVDPPIDAPDQLLPARALGFRVQAYGMTRWADLFTNRQLVALTTFSDLVNEAREKVATDARAAGLPGGAGIDDGGSEAAAYADAIAVYLGIVVSRLTDYQSKITTWASNPQMEILVHVFGRQAIPMAWDFAEGNPFADSSGSLERMVNAVAKALAFIPASGSATVSTANAAARSYDGALISTDPPYYDNVPYADLSDFFYVWLRRTLRGVLPSNFATMLVPKAEELVAEPFRHDGAPGAKRFFENGFREVFMRAREGAGADFPIAVFYAFKQSDSENDDEASSGWETLLDGMLRNGWQITATWPVRTESRGRLRATGSNALASSIVLALRPRAANAPTTDRRGFIAALHAELPDALRNLQHGLIAPVDLPQAAIGPGMAVFSRYAQVLEPDGSAMSVRSALARINEILDQVLSEQEGDFDPVSRFAIAWYRQHGYGTGKFGDADNIARARNTSVDFMKTNEILTSHANKVTLIRPSDTPVDYDVLADPYTSAWEGLHHLIRILDTEGVPAAGEFLATAITRPDGAIEADLVKELAFLLFSIAEKNGWTKDALSFNTLATSWAEILDASRAIRPSTNQGTLEFSEE